MNISFTQEELDIIKEALENYNEVTEDALLYDKEIMPLDHRLYLLNRIMSISEIQKKCLNIYK